MNSHFIHFDDITKRRKEMKESFISLLLSLCFFRSLGSFSMFFLKEPWILLHIFIYGSRYAKSGIDIWLSLRGHEGILRFHLPNGEAIEQINRPKITNENHYRTPNCLKKNSTS